MTALQAVLLGFVQGLTEFIPVSSSGHLVLVPALFGWSRPSVAVDVLLHGGTLVAAVLYFRRDIYEILTSDRKTGLWLVVATVPAAAAGVILQGFFESFFDKPAAAAGFLVLTGVLLVAADALGRDRLKAKELGAVWALFIGAWQALAIFPGVSRSGATLSGGMFAGLSRAEATRFAFLLSIPIIAGTVVFKAGDALSSPGGAAELLAALPGAATAAVTGYFTIRFFLRYVREHRLTVFAVYCWAAAAVYAASCLLTP